MTTVEQKVAIVTGASRGIGAGIVEGYRKHGYAVVATSRSIPASGDPQVHTVRGDLADPHTAARVVDAALERFGRIDALVNNAGLFLAKPFTAYTDDDLDAATRSLAVECAGTGVRVNAVSPGIIKTPMHPVEAYDAFATLHPMGRMGEVEEIVQAVLYLETAAFVTGETLHVDGGQSAGH